MSTQFKEIEFKYDASDIKLNSFMVFCRKRKPIKEFTTSGHDHFFESSAAFDSFFRLRTGNINQLTFKKKLDKDNNYVRIEHNIDLAEKMSEEDITKFCEMLGYSYNTTIFKSCFIFEYDYYTLVYYIVYDHEMKELGRFVEIEMNENHPWEDESHAVGELITMERICKPIGLIKKNRILKSLFELFKK